MKALEWSSKDKTGWPDGPWMDEPDKAQWQDEQTGLPCLIVRGPVGALCGYVGVEEGHPLFEVKGIPLIEAACGVHVNGGLTFGGFCSEGRLEGEGICHVVEAGENDRVWWLGFDCSHSWDVAPNSHRVREGEGIHSHDPGATYKSFGFVRSQVGDLAGELQRMSFRKDVDQCEEGVRT